MSGTLFGTDPFWLVVLKALALFVFLLVSVIFTIWLERRVVARMQMRLGPNRVGPFGLLQGLVDGVKIALKQDIIPKAADKPVFLLAPLIAAIPAYIAYNKFSTDAGKYAGRLEGFADDLSTAIQRRLAERG